MLSLASFLVKNILLSGLSKEKACDLVTHLFNFTETLFNSFFLLVVNKPFLDPEVRNYI